jgi:hypothetical protein
MFDVGCMVGCVATVDASAESYVSMNVFDRLFRV